MRSRWILFASTISCVAGVGIATPPDLIHNEVIGDSYLPNIWRDLLLPTPVLPEGALSPGVQVNVDANGLNIPGDAANEPSIGVDPLAPNRIVIGWRQFDTTLSNFRQAGNAWSNDGGRTWNNNPPIEQGIFRSDPVLDTDSDGNFYYYSLTVVNGNNFVCDLFKSTDGGQTWLPGVSAAGGDKQWFSVDKTGGIGNDHVYGVWSPFFSCCPEGNFTRSIDGGQNFMTPLALPSDLFWGATAIKGDGTLYLTGVDISFEPRVMRSTTARNSGLFPTFDINVPVDLNGTLVQGGGPNPGGLLGQVWIGVNPVNEDVYICSSVNPPGGDPLDVNFARSEDGGATWSAPVRVNDEAGNFYQWFGTMSVAPNGRIDVVWNDTSVDFSGNLSILKYSSSSDGGVTWAPSIALSSSFEHFVGYPNQNKLGDYYHMVSDDVGAHLAWAATHNGEQDVYYKRIGDYDCNGNGVGDADDLIAGDSVDCDRNGIPDECDIAAGLLDDTNDNGIPDSCETDDPGDVDGDGDVDIKDLLALLALWGDCPAPCAADFDNSGTVNITDLLTLLANWTGG